MYYKYIFILLYIILQYYKMHIVQYNTEVYNLYGTVLYCNIRYSIVRMSNILDDWYGAIAVMNVSRES